MRHYDRRDCKMRHENGNCLAVGGFCTSVNDTICEALQSAYTAGFLEAVELLRKKDGDDK